MAVRDIGVLVIKNDKSVYIAQVKLILNFHTIIGNYTQLTLDKLAWHNSLIILLFCSPKSPACDAGGTELDIFDTQGTLQGGRLE